MSASTEVKIYDNPSKVYQVVAEEILHLTQQSLQPQFHIALSGGNTPKELFTVLSKDFKHSIPWKRIHFWWGDERCVPPDHKNSNYKAAKDLLFSKIDIPVENIHRIKGENEAKAEADRYINEIEQNLIYRGDNPVFDLLILGLGEDGHTASIFPDQLELFEEKRICAVSQHPISGQTRITLTGKVLNNANRIFFLVTGANKSMRVSEIMNDEEAAKLLPAYYISPLNGNLIWFLDEDAANKIR